MKKDPNIQRPVIYQLLPRLYTNYCPDPVANGPIYRNGSGKLNLITPTVLRHIRSLGVTHVWYTGVIEHAHDADYTRYGIPRDNHIKGAIFLKRMFDTNCARTLSYEAGRAFPYPLAKAAVWFANLGGRRSGGK